MQRFKLVFFCPVPSTQGVLQHLFAKFPRHVGRIGLYGGCAFVSRGTGQFTPLAGANPAIGSVGTQEYVEENRVEVLVLPDSPAGPKQESRDSVQVTRVVEELKKVHPYEEVAYDVYRLEDF
ncbi:hypothetical protein BKA93DRAFT_731756 [Sparassis latifolia]|uniref:ATP phosphoribosyltransferase n=1 Tax=Sparassis crispa TaxID=139825 RepID=A0A401GF26_9APHY|nr:hypothetical protein SCP_0305060 [Sparassis crispa]GBE80787.1 hypothetical protein SCP_0305060 [Sparassis crispa]